MIMFGLPIVAPEQGGTAIIAGPVGALIVLLWWLLFSRAPWLERLAAIVLMVVAVAATSRLVHASIANGMMGFMVYLYAMPVLSLALDCLGRRDPRLARYASPRVARRGNHSRVRSVDARTNQRHQWRCGRGFRMALDADGRRTAPRASGRRAARARIHGTNPDDIRESFAESAQRGGRGFRIVGREES